MIGVPHRSAIGAEQKLRRLVPYPRPRLNKATELRLLRDVDHQNFFVQLLERIPRTPIRWAVRIVEEQQAASRADFKHGLYLGGVGEWYESDHVSSVPDFDSRLRKPSSGQLSDL